MEPEESTLIRALRQHIADLENALVEYVVRYGYTEQARTLLLVPKEQTDPGKT